MNRESESGIEYRLLNDGRLMIGTSLIEIPNLSFMEIIGSGANSLVFKAKHEYLDTIIAVKIWIKIRPGDKRDKFKQGIEEAKKAFRIKDSNVVRLYDAGRVNDYFYATMDYYPWITVKEWLNEFSPKLAYRWNLIRHIFKSVLSITTPITFHGDLHVGNILVDAIKNIAGIPLPERTPNFIIIDFGTSIFTTKENSIERHWRVFEATIDRILEPIKISEVWVPYAGERPDNFSERCVWYHVYLEEIPYMLRYLGADWTSLPISISIEKFTDKMKEALSNLVNSQSLIIDKETLGDYGAWQEDMFNVPYEYGEGM